MGTERNEVDRLKGYKAFNHDMTCRGFQYEVGKTYVIDDEIELCETGFHFCKNISDCFYYYDQYDARFAEVEALGKIVEADDNIKCVTNKIKIVKEIPRQETVDLSNTGDYNTGYWNTGHRNTGDMNTGDWNTTNFSSGCFNTEPQTIAMFNKPSEWTLDDYNKSRAAQILFSAPQEIDVIELVYSSDMTEEEKQAHPEHETTGGYLKVTKSNGKRQEWWDNLPQKYKDEVMRLPNFDKEIFKECTGIEVGEK